MELKTAQIQKQSVTVSPERKHCVSQRSVYGVPRGCVPPFSGTSARKTDLCQHCMQHARARTHTFTLSAVQASWFTGR